MKLAIISDIHGNLEALSSVSASIEGQDVDRIVFVGDAVGYGADPVGVIEMVRSMADVAVVGNHDYVACGKEEPSYFNVYASRAIMWTRNRLSAADTDYLRSLDVMVLVGDLTIVHATPLNPLDWDYLYTVEQAAVNYEAFATGLCFIGHSHVPGVFCMDGEGRVSIGDTDSLRLEEGCRYIVNVGSVGQPRDRDPRSCYVIYDTEKRSVDFLRVEYDVPAAQEKIMRAGLPPQLATRLAIGV